MNGENSRKLQGGFEFLKGVLGGLAEELGVSDAEFLEVGLAGLHVLRIAEDQRESQ